MKVKVIFNTIFGKVAVDGDMEYFVSDKYFQGDTRSWEETKAILKIPKPNPDQWNEDKRDYKVSFALPVVEDIRAIMDQNAIYLQQENNGRHHVELKTLQIIEIWIDQQYLRICWQFRDCYGTERVFTGYLYPILKMQNGDYLCGNGIKINVYF